MFGTVPRALWQQLYAPDARNMIPQNMNTLLIETSDGEFGLLDVGCGNPAWMSDRQREISGVDPHWQLADALTANGLTFADISFIILSHLHWDHAGAIGRVGEDASVAFTFAHAELYIHETEWMLATSADPLLFKAYPQAVIAPLRALPQRKRIVVSDTRKEIRPGIRFMHTGGHTAGHCAIVFDAESYVVQHRDAQALPAAGRAIYAGDVCPTQHHLRMVYHMGYDTYPMKTRAWKYEVLPAMAEQGDLLFFDHDPDLVAATLARHPQREVIPSRILEHLSPAALTDGASC